MRRYLLFVICVITLCIHSVSTLATTIPENSQLIDNTINKLYHSLNNKPNLSIEQRLDYFSQYWLNRPYILFSLGEGIHDSYDEMPRWRIDGFDCETFVDTVLALTFAKNSTTFRQCMDQIRYKNGHVSFITRNHFTALDWNTNNQKQGFLKDITRSIVDKKKRSVALESKTIIDKAAWYNKLPNTRIRVHNLSPQEQNKRLASLRKRCAQCRKQTSIVPYIPLNALFDSQGKPNTFLFAQIPQGAIVEIVRPNWNLTQEIGTHLDISHLGFAFWRDHVLYFRQASIIYQQVIDVPLVNYLFEARKSPTIGGINIQVVTVKKTFPNGCRSN